MFDARLLCFLHVRSERDPLFIQVPSKETKELLTGLPFIIAVVCGGFFLTRRHGFSPH
ncbi:hypothetical protein F2Q68_00040477 [Brassica cretica]|uniref:Uncharacterized protein n=1 Tax=Brassica cretica TaxID=69181 RepID=A0A8S9MMU6_BRACR|nr:hypothetical protein F2Q68_00040477 [Brassica cretica]